MFFWYILEVSCFKSDTKQALDILLMHIQTQTPHSGYVTLCYLNHCQHKNHVTMLYHVIDSKLQPLFTTPTAL